MSKPTAKTAFVEMLKLHKAGATVDNIVEHMAAQGVTSKSPAKTLARYAKELGAEKVELDGSAGYRLPANDSAPAEPAKDEAPAEPAQEAAPCQPEAAPCAPAEPKAPRRSRVQVTLAMLARPEGVTATELAARFAKEFDGNGKLSTARQALHKVPAKHGLTINKVKVEEGRDGIVYRSAA